MMRLTFATLVAILVSAPTWAQQNTATPGAPGTQPPAARVAAQGAPPAATVRQPFPTLNQEAKAQLQEVLAKWEKQSKGMKTLECNFSRWHYDMFAAPAGIHATRADGVIKYAAPDKGLFRVDRLVFFTGMENGKPQFKKQSGQFGEHWVCNGTQLIEFDRGEEECRIQDLPKEMQGKEIFNSPLPFVFNLDAQRIQQRYWVRQVAAPKPGVVLVEAWPKRQEDRAQYKLVQIALDEDTFLPQALIMYAPNFHPKTAPKWDHYEFTNSKRNAIGAGFRTFFNNFIAEKPPASWKILRNKFTPSAPPVNPPPAKQAAATAKIRG